MVAALLTYLPEALQSRLATTLQNPGFNNTLWLFSDRLIRMGVGLVVGVWIARYLGPDGYGLLSFTGSYVMLFSAVALFGLESLVVRELVLTPSASATILGTAFLIRLASGALAYLLALGTIMLLRPADRLALVLVAVLGSSLLLQASEVIDLWFQSRVASRYTVMVRIAAFLASALAKIVSVMAGASLTVVVVATAAESLLLSCGLLLVYRLRGGQLTSWRWDAIRFRALVSSAVPMVLSGIVLMVYLRIDQVMLGALAAETEVGYYAAAVRISEVWYFVPAAIVSSVFPRIVELRASDELQFHRKLQRLYNLLAFLGYAVALPVTLLSPWLVQLLFGAAYRPAGPLLSVLIWAGLFANLTVVRNAHFIALDWGRAQLWTASAGAVSNVVLNLVLIPRYGAMGAAVATCLSYWVAAHGACYVTRSLRPAAAMIVRALLAPRWW